MKAIIKGVYSNKTLGTKEFKNYQEAENYVFNKYNCVWDIIKENNKVTFEVYA